MTGGHAMPFGAELKADGTVRFRLWAPAQTEVAVVAAESGDSLPMERLADGWFELATDRIAVGAGYLFELADGFRVPDPASRVQAGDVHGPSVVVDPAAHAWQHGAWAGRPWHETVLYELHIGAFSAGGDFDGVRARLDELRALGATAVELMPLADFPGRRNWGYDGVLPFAPANAYGTPDRLKALIDEAHARDLMVFLDVVYNHFGPEGNYLHLYAPQFFTERHHTPWGAAIDFSVPQVREFFIHNALYWLEEYRFDGLRLDAVHAILDDSATHILTELAERVRTELGPSRHIHLVLENDDNEARYLSAQPERARGGFDAQWNDDFHHVAHHILTGEKEGYYRDYIDRSRTKLGRALAEGFVYQGEPSPYRESAPRGEPSSHLPATAFVDFLQNHDQVGNRAFGERLTALSDPLALRALVAIYLLAPQPPLLFMGEEWGTATPFRFFCDFQGELAEAVREGRRREFSRFPQFAEQEARSAIPDPNAETTFLGSCLDWNERASEQGRSWLEFYVGLLKLRHSVLVPRLADLPGGSARYRLWGETGLSVEWRLGDGSDWTLIANLADRPVGVPPAIVGEVVYRSRPAGGEGMPPWSCIWQLSAPSGGER